jgi:hypothetical protein
MTYPCDDCINAYLSDWDNGPAMKVMHKGCLDEIVQPDGIHHVGMDEPFDIGGPHKYTLADVIRDAWALHEAVRRLPIELWSDDMKHRAPVLAYTLSKFSDIEVLASLGEDNDD